MGSAERKRTYACDVTYSTANEAGFECLRDQLALYPEDQVLRPFAVALVDEPAAECPPRLSEATQ